MVLGVVEYTTLDQPQHMNDNFFLNVHNSVAVLLTLQKKNQPLGNGLRILRKELDERSSTAEEAELTGVCAAVIVGIRVLADGSLRDGSLSQVIEEYASIIDFAFTRGGLRLSLKWTEHVSPLLAILLSHNSESNHCTQMIITAVKKIVAYVIASTPANPEIFSYATIPSFGKLVFVCLDIISADSRSTESRLISAEILHIISYQKPARSSLSLVLPGLCSRISNFLCSTSPLTNQRILLLCIETLFNSIFLSLEDGTFVSEKIETNHTLYQDRTLVWAQEAAERVSLLVTNILARLCKHCSEEIRFSLLRGIKKLLHCKEAFGDVLRPACIDLVLLYLEDSYKNLAAFAKEVLESIRSPETQIYLIERLSEMTKNLPSAVLIKLDSSPALKQIASILVALDKTIGIMVASKSPVIVDLLQALSTVIRINFKRLAVCLTSADTIKASVLAIPLKFDVDLHLIGHLCSILAKNMGDEIIELILEEKRDCSKGAHIALILKLFFITEQLPAANDDVTFERVAEFCCQELTNMPPESIFSDSLVNETSEMSDESTAYGVVVLASLLASTKKISGSSNKILMHSIYKILQLCSSSKWIISEVAGMVLKDLAKHRGITISALLVDNSSYVLSSTILCCRSFEAHSLAPLAFESFLNRVDDPAVFEIVHNLVLNFLTALDIHRQKWTWIILRSLKAFVAAINRWFPCIKLNPSNMEDEEQKEQIPEQIAIVEKILSRTKYLLSSKALPIRIVSMDILLYGIRVLRHFDNQLLPMVHQNWLTLINRFEDKEVESRRAAFMVIVEMAKITKSFVYRKVMLELWPRLEVWLQNNVQNRNACPQNVDFRLCDAVVSNLGEMLANIGATSEDWQKIRPILELFLSTSTHPALADKAKTSFLQFDKYLELSK